MPTLKQALAEKITSKEQFDTVLREANRANISYIGNPEVRSGSGITHSRTDYIPARCYDERDDRTWPNGRNAPYFTGTTGEPTDRLHHTRWWLVREWLRIRTGVYELSDVVGNISWQWPGLALHCTTKKEDPLLVAYTPDPAAGERDAQVTISLGKFLRKMYPHISDDDIQRVEAQHRADMSDEVEFITGADAMVDAYLNGPQACMSKTRSYWRTENGLKHHPVEVYDAPNLALAVTRGADGGINSRALVYVNPDDENDKRYVRAYGDDVLVRRLKRRGFRCAGLEGLQVRRIDAGKHAGSGYATVMMPYLDTPGHRADGEKAAVYVLLDSDERYVRLVSRATRDKLISRGIEVPSGQSTSGYVCVSQEANVEALNVVCPITKQKFDPDTETTIQVLVEGVPMAARAAAAEQLAGWATVTAMSAGGVWVPTLCPPGTAVFTVNGADYLDSAAMRESFGFVALDPALYPNTPWTTEETRRTSSRASILVTDMVHFVEMVNGAPSLQIEHVSRVADRKLYSVIHRVSAKVPMFVHKDVPVVKTVGGRSVVEGVHEVVRLHDGTIEFQNKAKEVRSMGCSFWVPRAFNGEVPLETWVLPALRKTLPAQLKSQAAYYYEHDDPGAYWSRVAQLGQYHFGSFTATAGDYYDNQSRSDAALHRHWQFQGGSSSLARTLNVRLWPLAVATARRIVADEVIEWMPYVHHDAAAEKAKAQVLLLVDELAREVLAKHLLEQEVAQAATATTVSTAAANIAANTIAEQRQRYVIAA